MIINFSDNHNNFKIMSNSNEHLLEIDNNATNSKRNSIEFRSIISKRKSSNFINESNKQVVEELNSNIEGECSREKFSYKCSICEKIFKKYAYLKSHQKTHNEAVLEHTCTECGKKYATAYYLKIHFRSKHSGVRPFICDICGKNYTAGTYLRKHQITHNELKTCQFCLKKFDTIEELIQHKLEHKINKTLECRICGKKFGLMKYLKVHMRWHSDANFKCTYCSKTFIQNSDLTRHLRNHTGDKIPCKTCGKMYITSNALKRHEETHRTTKLQCDFCDKIFMHQKNLKQHLKNHTNENKQCPNCWKYFIRLDKHKCDASKIVKNYECEKCHQKFTQHQFLVHTCVKPEPETAFKTEKDETVEDGGEEMLIEKVNNIIESLNTYTGSILPNLPNEPCSFCHKQFKTKSELIRHLATHKKEKLYCELCSKMCSSKDAMKVHLKRHIGDSRFQCQFCNRKCVKKSEFDKHVRIHTGQRPFVCQFCNKAFTGKSGLKKHIIIHTDKKNTTCDICGKTMAVTSLSKHKRTIHNPRMPHECKICRKKYMSQQILDLHKCTGPFSNDTLHKKLKVYKCKICGEKFTQPELFLQHKKIHENDVNSFYEDENIDSSDESIHSISQNTLLKIETIDIEEHNLDIKDIKVEYDSILETILSNSKN